MPGFPKNGKNTPHHHQNNSIQVKIETILTNLVNSGLYDAIYLFDETGLPIVQRKKNQAFSNDIETVEVTTLMNQIKSSTTRIEEFEKLNEIIIESSTGKRLIFRFIDFFGQTATLVAIIPQGKSYRNMTNNLLRTLDRLTESEL